MTAPRELVRLPVGLSWFDRAKAPSRKRSIPSGSAVHLYVVERVTGHAWTIASDRTGAAALELPAVGEPATGADHEAALPARLSLDDCRKRIEALASRSAFILGRGRMVDVTALETLCEAGYPFWLSYRRDRRGRIDFDAIDAVTGKRAGGPLRTAIASALIDADRKLATSGVLVCGPKKHRGH